MTQCRQLPRLRLTIAMFLGLVQVSMSPGQQPDGLPSNWKSLPPAEVVKLLKPFYDPVQDKLVGNIDEQAIRAQAAEQITKIDFAKTKLNYQILDAIHWAADPKLTPEQQEEIRKAVVSRQDEWHGLPYAEIKGKSMLMRRLKLPVQLRVREGRRWALAGGKLASVPAKDMPEAEQYFIDAEAEHIDSSFQVNWEGTLTAPTSGLYKLSISPIDVNSNDLLYPLKVSMVVAIAGKDVITATSKKWDPLSASVNFTADQPVPIRASFKAECARTPNHALHALLCWEGPGIERAVIPEDCLKPPAGDRRGLQGTYSWIDNGLPKLVRRVDPRIDFAWTATPISVFANGSATAQMNDLFWDQTTSAEFFSWCENQGGAPRVHPFFQDPDSIATCLSSERRRTFIDQVLLKPALLDSVSIKQCSLFYGAFRIGAPEAALNVFGQWAVRHADLECDLPRRWEFEPETRLTARRMAIYVTREMPEQASRLEKEYLVSPEGRCVLPVAYTLAHSYLVRDKMSDWVRALDKRLNDVTLSGDARINWLLSRAVTEEIRQSQPDVKLNTEVFTRLLDGKRFLEEAERVAETPEAKLRTAKELAGRLICTNQLNAARKTIEQVPSDLPEEQQSTVTNWIAWIDALEDAKAGAAARSQKAVRTAYLTILKKRRQEAEQHKDARRLKRYNELIDAASANR